MYKVLLNIPSIDGITWTWTTYHPALNSLYALPYAVGIVIGVISVKN